MNTDDTRFDRLVDDELSEEERRELLGRLDDEPGGWRRCALAFLEAQCWKQVARRSVDRNDSRSAGVTPASASAGETPRSLEEPSAVAVDRAAAVALGHGGQLSRGDVAGIGRRTAHGSDIPAFPARRAKSPATPTTSVPLPSPDRPESAPGQRAAEQQPRRRIPGIR